MLIDRRLEPIFRETGISPEWLYILIEGVTEFFNNDTEVLNYLLKDGIVYINAAGIDESHFSFSILKRIIQIARSYDIVLATTNCKISKHIKDKYDLEYDYEHMIYTRKR